jgi:hypothetical protein
LPEADIAVIASQMAVIAEAVPDRCRSTTGPIAASNMDDGHVRVERAEEKKKINYDK